MKIFTKILKPLAEGEYEVEIKSFKAYQNGSEVDIKKLTQAQLDKMIEKKNGYFDLNFVTTGTDPKRQGTLRIWPARFQWTLAQIADKADKEFDDTNDIIGEKIPLAYQHGYVANGAYVQNKQWSLYPSNSAVLSKEEVEDLNV